DRVDVAADVTDFGELRGFDLDERRAGEPRKAARDFGFADTGWPDHQDVLRRDFVAQVFRQLHAAPAVAQRDCHGALRGMLADDVLVEFGGDFAGAEFGHDQYFSSSIVRLWFVYTQMSPAMVRPFSTMLRASSSVFANRAFAAACAKAPPEPMAIRLSSGSMTSPLPVMMSEASRSATSSRASRRRNARSLRQSFASSTAARVSLPWCFSSCSSKRSNSVKASAVPPAKPASTWSRYRRRTLRALPLSTVWPWLTWPSPPMTTLPWRRTDRMVVPCNCSMP